MMSGYQKSKRLGGEPKRGVEGGGVSSCVHVATLPNPLVAAVFLGRGVAVRTRGLAHQGNPGYRREHTAPIFSSEKTLVCRRH